MQKILKLASVGLVLLLLSAKSNTPGESPFPMPSVKVLDMDNKQVDLKMLAATGKTTIYSFWATWCGPCKKELISYNTKVAEWKKKYNADFYAVSVDQDKNVAQLKDFGQKMGWHINLLFDDKQLASQTFKISSIPYLIVVDKKGNVVHKQIGYDPGNEEAFEKRLLEIK